MRVTYRDGVRVVRFRQSWINDWHMCNYRAHEVSRRFPDGTPPTHQTALGTATHAGVEAYLHGGDATQIRDSIEAAFRAEVALMPPEYITANTKDLHKAVPKAIQCAIALIDEAVPQVRSVDSIEYTFDIAVDRRGGTELRLKGTWDLDEGIGRPLWDWKTSGSSWKYDKWKLDRWYIQPTVYTLAKAVTLGLPLDEPQVFKYGVAVKSADPYAEIYKVTRGPEDWAWLIARLWDAVEQLDQGGASRNDHGWHCSEKWCAVYSECKGLPRELPVTLLQPQQPSTIEEIKPS